MNRRDLVRAIAAYVGEEVRQVESVMQGFTDVVTAAVAKGEPVAISGFAKFAKVERAARMGRNPATGEPIRIKASKRARVTPLKGLKQAVANPATAPKVARGILEGTIKPPTRKAAAKPAPARKAPAKKKTTARKAPAKKRATTRRTASRR